MSAESSSRHWSVRRPGAEPPPWGPNWRMGEGLALTSLKGSGTGPELGRASAGLGPFSTRELENRFSIPKREGFQGCQITSSLGGKPKELKQPRFQKGLRGQMGRSMGREEGQRLLQRYRSGSLQEKHHSS
ncbi:uncharacterized protein ACBT57_003004 isoform 1-T1 [Dama dama]